jgi:hypothetical protein
MGRVVGDVKEGSVIGVAIVARAALASAMWLKAIAGAATQVAVRIVRAVCLLPFALARRSMLLAANAARAVGGAVVSAGRVGWHIATAATRAVAQSIAAVYAFTLAVARRSMLGVANAAGAVAGAVVSGGGVGWNIATAATRAVAQSIAAVYAFTLAVARRSMLGVANAASAVGGAVVSGGGVGWHVTVRIVTGVLLVLLAIGLGLAAIVVGIVSAARTGIMLLARATGVGSRQLWEATRVASRSGAAAGFRASVAAGKALARGGAVSSDAAIRASATSRAFLSRLADTVSGMRLTVRWRARSARPIVGAMSGEFARQLVQSIRQARPRHAGAGLAVAVAVLIAAVYGSPRRDRRVMAPPSSSASSEPALASVAPAPGADTAALVRSLKDQSAALLAPSPKRKGTLSTSPAAAATADGDQEADVPRDQSMLGTLTIASAPKGAKVTIDGIPRGLSPLSVSRLRAGNRMVRLELDGYQRWSWAVYVSAARPTHLNVSLVPDSAPSPSSAVTNTAAAAK